MKKRHGEDTKSKNEKAEEKDVKITERAGAEAQHPLKAKKK